MRKEERPTVPCANSGCHRPAAPGEPLCETCSLEEALYHRDTRIWIKPPVGTVDAPRSPSDRMAG